MKNSTSDLKKKKLQDYNVVEFKKDFKKKERVYHFYHFGLCSSLLYG